MMAADLHANPGCMGSKRDIAGLCSGQVIPINFALEVCDFITGLTLQVLQYMSTEVLLRKLTWPERPADSQAWDWICFDRALRVDLEQLICFRTAYTLVKHRKGLASLLVMRFEIQKQSFL